MNFAAVCVSHSFKMLAFLWNYLSIILDEYFYILHFHRIRKRTLEIEMKKSICKKEIVIGMNFRPNLVNFIHSVANDKIVCPQQ